MAKTVYVRTQDARSLIELSAASSEQRRTCDRVVLDSDGEFVREVKAKNLRLIDVNLALVNPVDKNELTIGHILGAYTDEDRLLQLI